MMRYGIPVGLFHAAARRPDLADPDGRTVVVLDRDRGEWPRRSESLRSFLDRTVPTARTGSIEIRVGPGALRRVIALLAEHDPRVGAVSGSDRALFRAVGRATERWPTPVEVRRVFGV